MKTNESSDEPTEPVNDLNSQPFYHGTKADLNRGDLIQIGFSSNYGTRKKAKYIYLTATLEAATWEPNLLWAKDAAEFISSNRPDSLKTILI